MWLGALCAVGGPIAALRACDAPQDPQQPQQPQQSRREQVLDELERQALADRDGALLVVGSAALAFAVASILSYEPAEQRYLETPVAEIAGTGDGLRGATRRRQPRERFELKRRDEPGPARSYPDRPA